MEATLRFAGRRISQVPELATLWGRLTERILANLVRHGLDSPLVFRNCVDGPFTDITQLVIEMGGAGDDAATLLEFWKRAERTDHSSRGT